MDKKFKKGCLYTRRGGSGVYMFHSFREEEAVFVIEGNLDNPVQTTLIPTTELGEFELAN